MTKYNMKNKINIAASLIVALVAFISCQDKPSGYEFPKDEYFYDIPDVPVTEDYVVGVSYDMKFRDTTLNAWMDGTTKQHQLYTGTPLLGEYDMRKELIPTLHQHMDWAAQAGINFFIMSWGGHGFNDTIIQEFGNYYKQGYPQLVIRFDPGYRFPKAGTDTMLYNAAVMDTLRMDFDSLYTYVMKQPYAYKNKTNGKPAMVLTNINNTANIPSINTFTKFLRSTVNNDIWIMAELQGQWTSPERWGYNAANGYAGAVSDGWVQPDTIKAFDAFFITDISTSNKDRYDGFYSFLDYNYKYWQKAMAPLGKEYIPTIMPAFDNLVNNPLSNNYLIPRWKEGTGAYVISGNLPDAPKYNWSNLKENPYKTLANVAKRNVGPSRIVIIYGWNDYNNGDMLEPTEEFGTDYLQYTKQFFKK